MGLSVIMCAYAYDIIECSSDAVAGLSHRAPVSGYLSPCLLCRPPDDPSLGTVSLKKSTWQLSEGGICFLGLFALNSTTAIFHSIKKKLEVYSDVSV